ncbi:alpha/beta hydrolase family protein [Nocardia sp. NPDC047038]|uniref:alpha/beta hydrolase n=1 Tax=Nocardia sp. NPDC047038 TaxID=3154338 RepID=UPI0033E69967
MPGYSHRTGAVLAAVLIFTCVMIAAQPVARADPSRPVAADGSRIVENRVESDRQSELEVYSAAMNSATRIRVLRAADPDTPAPTFYLLNGANGGSEGNWLDGTDLVDFFRDKQVNVVIPFGGAGSYFTDWRSDDPVLGRQRWSTFLTEELPPLIDATFNGTGTNAIAGISMAGTSVFQLAMAAPGLYKAIGSYSGCVRTSDPAGQAVVQAVVTQQRGTVANMWGPPTDPAWRANDPYLHADRLRGTAIYVSTGTGLPGPKDDFEGAHGDLAHLLYQLVFGAPLEAVANLCTHQLQDRLRQLGVAATFDFRPNGTHSWGYWHQDLRNSWPMIEAAIR